MARIFMDGFESGHMGLWNNTNTRNCSIYDIGGGGIYCHKVDQSGESIASIPPRSEIYIAMRIRFWNYSGDLLYFYNNATPLARCSPEGITGLQFTLGLSSTIYTQFSNAIFTNNNYLLEIFFRPHMTNGSVVVKVDGNVVHTYVGQTSISNDPINRISLVNARAYIDNFIIDDTEWPGNTKIVRLPLTANVGTPQWTPSTGDNWNCIDEVPKSNTDYISTNVVNNTDIFTKGNVPSEAYSVKSLSVNASQWYEGTPTPTQITGVITDGVTTVEATPKDITMAESSKQFIFNTDVNGNPWVINSLNNHNIGIRSK